MDPNRRFSIHKRAGHWLRSLRRAAWLLAPVLMAIFPTQARNTNFQLCVPQTQYSGFGQGPDIKNKPVSTDGGWTGAFRYVFGNGTTVPDVVVQGIQDGTSLFISVEAHNMSSWFDDEGSPNLSDHTHATANAVVITFDGDSTAAHMQRLVIQPVVPKAAERPAPDAVGEIDYSQDSSVWDGSNYSPIVFQGPSLATSWITARATYTCQKQNNQCITHGYDWGLAVQLPMTTSPADINANPSNTSHVLVPSNGTLGFYVNVVRIIDQNAQQLYWPNNDPQCPINNPNCQAMPGCTNALALGCTPNTLTPDPSTWGFSTRDTNLSCRGVSIGSQVFDIYTDQGISVFNGVNEPRINTNPAAQNNFFANVHNNTVDGNGVAIPASQILTTFRIADFGIASPPDWQTLPPSVGSPPFNTCTLTNSNPTKPLDIGANSSTLFQMGPWCLTSNQITAYSTNTTKHQCVKVQLDSTPVMSFNISTISRATNVVSVTTTSNNPFVANQAVTVAGVSDSSYNGTFTIASVTSPTQFTYSQTGGNSSSSLGTVSIGGTIIVNNTGFQNMNFGFASKFERAAVISAHGYPARPCPTGQTCPTDQLFDLQIASRTDRFRESCRGQNTNLIGVTAAGNKTALGTGETGAQCSQITYVVHACRHTGTYITINKQTLELCDGAGAFGWAVRHDGDTTNWTTQLSGPGLESGGTGIYHIHVPQNGTTAVTASLEPEYPGEDRLAAHVDVGGAFPHGNFPSSFNAGFSLNAGLEYIFTKRLSAEGIFGYHHFPANIGSSLNIYQFSANAKVYVRPSGWRPFFNAGIGGYHLTSIGTDFGGNFGAGMLMESRRYPHWGAQGSYNFHVVNATGGAVNFSTAQVGLGYLF